MPQKQLHDGIKPECKKIVFGKELKKKIRNKNDIPIQTIPLSECCQLEL